MSKHHALVGIPCKCHHMRRQTWRERGTMVVAAASVGRRAKLSGTKHIEDWFVSALVPWAYQHPLGPLVGVCLKIG